MDQLSQKDRLEMEPIISALRKRASTPTGRIIAPREDVSVLPRLENDGSNTSSQPSNFFPGRRKNVSVATNRSVSPLARAVTPVTSRSVSPAGLTPVMAPLISMTLAKTAASATISDQQKKEIFRDEKLRKKEAPMQLTDTQQKRIFRSTTKSMKRTAPEIQRKKKSQKNFHQQIALQFNRKQKKIEKTKEMCLKITEIEKKFRQKKSANQDQEMEYKKKFMLEIERARKFFGLSYRTTARLLHPPISDSSYRKELKRAHLPIKNQGRKKISYLPLVKAALTRRSYERKDAFSINKKSKERRRQMEVSFLNCYLLEKDKLENITYSQFMYAVSKLRKHHQIYQFFHRFLANFSDFGLE